LLGDEGVRYLLIGGYAVGYYGYPRATADMDVWVEASEDNAAKCAAALEKFGMTTPDLDAALFLEEHRIIRMGEPPLRIEMHTGISGVNFAACYARRQCVDWHGIEVSLIGLDDLKANKRASGRHVDLADLEHLP